MYNDQSFLLFSETARDVCNYICVAILCILIFIVSPLRQYSFLSLLGKTAILLILGWAAYKNVKNAHELMKTMPNRFLDGTWDTVKSNIVCSYILTFFIVVLAFSVLQHMKGV